MKYFAEVRGRRFECEVEVENSETFVQVNGTRYRVDLEHVAATGAYSLLVDGRSFEFALHDHGEDYELAGAAGSFRVRVEDERTRAARDVVASAGGPKGPHKIKSAMPGIVRELRVAVGDQVAKGQALMILEAMKMQNEIRADRDGVVAAVHVVVLEAIEKGAPLMDLDASG